MTAFIKESIVKPAAYVEPGYQDVMPADFGTSIAAAQLDQLVQYLEQSAK